VAKDGQYTSAGPQMACRFRLSGWRRKYGDSSIGVHWLA